MATGTRSQGRLTPEETEALKSQNTVEKKNVGIKKDVACESAAQSLRNYLAEDVLFWFQNQLFGEACRVMLGVKFQSVNHFIEVIKQTFGSLKT
ncbi:hypothetical protein M0802_013661 [Mischocyttarus mexicanus]|nr:hypothetical protein M0802_013661 [Mischocyttarus mexicanus]